MFAARDAAAPAALQTGRSLVNGSGVTLAERVAVAGSSGRDMPSSMARYESSAIIVYDCIACFKPCFNSFSRAHVRGPPVIVKDGPREVLIR